MGTEILLSYHGVGKQYPGSRALAEVSFEVKKGSVHAITGGNGAGKSTLMKITTGAVQPTEGTVTYAGKEIRFSDPGMASRMGITMVPQVVTLCDTLTVKENLFLNDLSARGRMIRWGRLEKKAEAVLREAGVQVSPNAVLGELPIAKKQLVSILRASLKEPKLLILDEPSAVLTDAEIRILYGLIRQLKEKGMTILYISHRMEEIFDLADTITVLRDGRHVGTFPREEVTREELIRRMVGRDVEDLSDPPVTGDGTETVVRATDLTTHQISHASFEVKKGEILGIAGLVGSGRTELMRALLGMDPLLAGTVEVRGKAVRYTEFGQAMEDGFALVPEDRVHQGLVTSMSTTENMTLSSLRRFTRLGFVSRKREKVTGEQYRDKLAIKASSLEASVGNLSGGNQQKVALARWMIKDSRILVLDEPTQGIDVAAKAEIYGLIRDMAAQGRTVILISSETNELVGLCRRVLVMREGRIAGELREQEITKENIMTLAMADLPPKETVRRRMKASRVIPAAAVLAVLAVIFFLLVGKPTDAQTYMEIPETIELRDTDVLQGKRLSVCFVYKGDAWCAQVADSFAAIGAHYGANITFLDGDLNAEVQTRQIENAISAGSDMILVDPCSTRGMDAILNQVVQADIPLMIIDQSWANAGGKPITLVTWDQYTTGRMIGEYLVDYMRKRDMKEASLLELTIVSTEHNLVRYQGFHDALDEATDLTFTFNGQFDYQGIREQAEKAVSAVAVPIDFIISDSDNGAQGALVALRQAGNKDVRVLCMGAYGEECFTELYRDDPNYLALLNVDAWIFVDRVMDCVIDYYEGKELPEIDHIPLYVVDHDNVTEFWDFPEA